MIRRLICTLFGHPIDDPGSHPDDGFATLRVDGQPADALVVACRRCDVRFVCVSDADAEAFPPNPAYHEISEIKDTPQELEWGRE